MHFLTSSPQCYRILCGDREQAATTLGQVLAALNDWRDPPLGDVAVLCPSGERLPLVRSSSGRYGIAFHGEPRLVLSILLQQARQDATLADGIFGRSTVSPKRWRGFAVLRDLSTGHLPGLDPKFRMRPQAYIDARGRQVNGTLAAWFDRELHYALGDFGSRSVDVRSAASFRTSPVTLLRAAA